MAGKLSSAFTAVCAAVYVGSNIFGVVAALGWALTRDLGFADNAVTIGFIAALPFGVLGSVWFARLAYRVERTMDEAPLIS